jgi:phosphopantothenoylcysteine decarboxylase/phosphopantothenate--cysteine ligase
VQSCLPADVFIGAAAVADWRVEHNSTQKLKKDAKGELTLHLVENPDVLATVANSDKSRPRLVVGFAAETQEVLDYARQKLVRKNCDFIVANAVGIETGVFGGADNQVHIVTRDNVISWPKMSKDKVALALVEIISEKLDKAENLDRAENLDKSK